MCRFFLGLFLAFYGNMVFAQNQTDDVLLDVLRQELFYYYDNLRTDSLPIRFISFNALEEHTVDIESDMGSSSLQEKHDRKFYPIVSFGEYRDIASKNPFDLSYEDWNDSRIRVVELPLENDVPVIKDVIWSSLGRAYRGSMAVWQRISLNSEPIRKEYFTFSSSCHYEELNREELLDKSQWKGLLNEITRSQMELFPEALCNANLVSTDRRRYVVDTEGTLVVFNRRSYRLVLSVNMTDAMGIEHNLTKNYFRYDLSEMPNVGKLKSDLKELILRTKAVCEAPMADMYSGPVILSGKAAAILFHEVLGHRLESHDSEFMSMKGIQVLPTDMNVICNPSKRFYNGFSLSGYYQYDDLGMKGEQVECISHGVLKDFLSCRSSDMPGNGHGRAEFGKTIKPRMSNLIVETSSPHTETELRGMLIDELVKQNKQYGYFIRSVNRGWTVNSGNRNVSSFKLIPVEAYKIYLDGRPDEQVRLGSVFGTPLSVLGNIRAAGDNSELFDGSCGGESGWISVSCVSPMLYISQIDVDDVVEGKVKKRGKTFCKFPFVYSDEEHHPDSVILQAMTDELRDCSESVVDADGNPPYFIDYNLRRQANTHIVSSMGACLKYAPTGIKTNGLVSVIAGNRMHTSYNPRNAGRPFPISDEISYQHIRREFGHQTSLQISNVSIKYENKRNQSFLDTNIPEWAELPGKKIILESALTHWSDDATFLRSLADSLSVIFRDYPELFDTRVEINQSYADRYRVTSEGLCTRNPFKSINIDLFASVVTLDGRALNRRDGCYAYDVNDLPSKDTLFNYIRQFAEKTLYLGKKETIEENDYIGPVLYQNTASFAALIQEHTTKPNLYNYLHSYLRLDSRQYDDTYRKIGKKVISSNLSVRQLADDSLFNGRRLGRYQKYDADGVRTNSVELIRDGILLNQLSGRVPSPGALSSTGNEYMNDNWSSGFNIHPTHFLKGVLRIDCKKTMSTKRLIGHLRRLARKQGLKYAYILKDSGSLARLDVETGKEELMGGRCYIGPTRLEMWGDIIASKEMNAVLEESVIYPQSILLPISELVFSPFETSPICKRFIELRHTY